ncbi:hypothetical protein [Natrialba sp. SSL1]|uniref:hypothetical protein n=1 Tax=Natrialba sp. SSL1 TaxID=1869245 RepID=UPI0014958118|nr:hypothetical protein [Natrialba sp. SSL1]
MLGVRLGLLGITFVLLAIFLGEGAWRVAYLGVFVSIAGVFVGSGTASSAAD